MGMSRADYALHEGGEYEKRTIDSLATTIRLEYDSSHGLEHPESSGSPRRKRFFCGY